LLVVDNEAVDETRLRAHADETLVERARENVQILVRAAFRPVSMHAAHCSLVRRQLNGIWNLPTRRQVDAVLAELPTPTFRLPRMRSIPESKPQTRWEKFAESKGIKKTKKSRKVWDDERKAWVPRFGYQGKQEIADDWVLEMKGNAPGMV
jgi:hypothetical protein